MVKQTQKKMNEIISEIRDRYIDNQYLNKSDFENILNIYEPALITKHGKQKIYKIQMRMDTTKNQKRYLQFIFIYKDFQDNFNKRKAVYYKYHGKMPPKKDKNNTKMREAINPQTLRIKNQFCRQGNIICCELCNKYFDYKKIEVDHYPKTFNTLKNDFLKENNLNESEDLNEGSISLWSKYHEKNAMLRLVCKSCHKKHGKKK